MANNYFDFLSQNSVPTEQISQKDKGVANITVKVDADCQVVCDGDFLFLVNANQITKEKAPIGQHIIQFISTKDPNSIIEKIVDWPEENKNYLLLIDSLQGEIERKSKERSDSSARLAEEQKKQELENNAMKTEQQRVARLNSIPFVDKFIDAHTSCIKQDFDIVEMDNAINNEIIPAIAIGNAEAAFVYSQLLRNGQDGIAKDNAKSIELLKYAAEYNVPIAQNVLGVRIESGDGFDVDINEAIKWYIKAASQGYYYAQNNLGNCYYSGNGVTQDYFKAVEWYTKSAEQGNSYAQYNLGNCYYYGKGVNLDYSKAVEWYKKAAEQGYSWAQERLGYCCYHGLGIDMDHTKALEWFSKSAEQGCAQAQCDLGDYYHDFLTPSFADEPKQPEVPEDIAERESVKWYTKSASQGYGTAIERLAYHYAYRARTSEEFLIWTIKAAELGDAISQIRLANAYYYGYHNVVINYAEAIRWCKCLAENPKRYESVNMETSNYAYILGECYRMGRGVDINITESAKWYYKDLFDPDARVGSDCDYRVIKITTKSAANGTYIGPINSIGRPQGGGYILFENGVFFTGQFRDGLRNGYGIIELSIGKYQGNYSDDVICGDGMFIDSNGKTYQQYADGRFVTDSGFNADLFEEMRKY